MNLSNTKKSMSNSALIRVLISVVEAPDFIYCSSDI